MQAIQLLAYGTATTAWYQQILNVGSIIAHILMLEKVVIFPHQ
jgi:hypothetical protein